MRRKAGAILPIEESILRVTLGSTYPLHGFEMAKRLQEIDSARRLTAYGTLYKALSRMEKAGLLESSWEDPQVAASERRPRRRLHRITDAGEVALSRLDAARLARLRPREGFTTP